MAIVIKVPVAMDTPLQKWRWTHRTNNRMTLLHNLMGKMFTKGLTLDEYNATMVIRNSIAL